MMLPLLLVVFVCFVIRAYIVMQRDMAESFVEARCELIYVEES